MFLSPFSREEFFAGLAVLVAVIRYFTYLSSMYRRETRPHVFSWFNWGLATGIAAYAEFKLGGGPSVWILAIVTIMCLVIAALALFAGEKNITKSDWAAFIGALIAIVIWQLTSYPLLAITCIILTDLLSYWPTVRKSWHDPWGEPPKSYFWGGLRYFLAVFAVSNPHFSNLIYPVWLVVLDWGAMLYFFWRQKALSEQRVIKTA